MFTELNTIGKAINLEKKGQSVQGFVTGVKAGIGKFKKSRIFTLTTEDKGTLEVWGNARINQALLDPSDKKQATITPGLQGVFVRLTFLGEKKLPGRRQPMKDIKVEADFEKRLDSKAKSYVLGNRKFKK